MDPSRSLPNDGWGATVVGEDARSVTVLVRAPRPVDGPIRITIGGRRYAVEWTDPVGMVRHAIARGPVSAHRGDTEVRVTLSNGSVLDAGVLQHVPSWATRVRTGDTVPHGRHVGVRIGDRSTRREVGHG